MNRLGALLACAMAASCVAWGQDAKSTAVATRKAPKIWDDAALHDWAISVAGMRPQHYTAAELYAVPVDNVRTYPVYHPDREPAGYLDSLRKRGAEPLIEIGKARTKEEWVEAGARVWEELDVIQVRTSDFRIIDYFRSREALKKYPPRMTKDGQLFDFRWIVDKAGNLQLGSRECSGCHTRVMENGTVISGSQANFQPTPAAPMNNFLFSVFSIPKEPGEELPSPGETAYLTWGVPWLKDDIHEKIKTMSPPEVQVLNDADAPGTIARFNGSPYFTTKIPSLIGVKNSRYLDATGSHRNRGPEDIARYAILVGFADDGTVGPHRVFTGYQRKLQARYSDDAAYALGMFIYYGLKEPKNPNPPDELSKRGQKVFATAGCVACHTPPAYTNGMLIPVDGFTPPDNEETKGLQIMRGVRVGTDPGGALKTRKGTGYYKVPPLTGLWHKGLIEHSGSIANLEEWFDRKRLSADYVPSGWKGPGVKQRAVPGHEFGMDLGAEDKRALIAFLKTL